MDVMRPVLLLILAAGVAVPVGHAEPTVHAWLEPADQTVTIPAAGRANLSYAWRVAFEETVCQEPDDEVGVDFLIDQDVTWPRMSFQPSGAVAKYPEDDGVTMLEIYIDEAAPRPGETVVRLVPNLNPVVLSCVPSPEPREDMALLTIQVPAGDPATSPTGDGTDGGSSPGAGFVWIAFAMALAAFLRRR